MMAVEPADFRKGIDGLAGICRKVLHEDPFGGSVFIFRKDALHNNMINFYGIECVVPLAMKVIFVDA